LTPGNAPQEPRIAHRLILVQRLAQVGHRGLIQLRPEQRPVRLLPFLRPSAERLVERVGVSTVLGWPSAWWR
jgi:hypothetical protein